VGVSVREQESKKTLMGGNMRQTLLTSVPTAFLASTLSLFAQSAISGYVTGVVVDPSKAVVPNATVSLQNPATSLNFSTSTNPKGFITSIMFPREATT
jgi:hypothetical protein